MDNRKIDRKNTKQIVIETELHQRLKLMATKRSMTIKTLVEGVLAEFLAIEERS